MGKIRAFFWYQNLKVWEKSEAIGPGTFKLRYINLVTMDIIIGIVNIQDKPSIRSDRMYKENKERGILSWWKTCILDNEKRVTFYNMIFDDKI